MHSACLSLHFSERSFHHLIAYVTFLHKQKTKLSATSARVHQEVFSWNQYLLELQQLHAIIPDARNFLLT